LKTLAGYVRKAQPQANGQSSVVAGRSSAPDNLRSSQKALP
jgi:hypothetical protein